jgi:carboxypeptidase T
MLETILSLFLLQTPSANNYDQILKNMDQIVAANPGSAQVFTMGTNSQGQPIKGLKIGNGAVNSLIVGTHHGNEYGSTAVALGFAADLAKNPIQKQTVYVIPVLNISGYNRNDRYESNVTGSVTDANRDYPSPCKKDAPYQLKSTEALSQFLVDKNIQISATLHTYWPAVVYPWGISTTDLSTPYDDQYKMLVAAATQESKYQTGNNTQVLYPADGTFEDYAYFKHGIWSLLFELGFSHNPDPQAVKNMIEVNTPGIRRFLEQSPTVRVANHGFSGKCDARMPRRVILE